VGQLQNPDNFDIISKFRDLF